MTRTHHIGFYLDEQPRIVTFIESKRGRMGAKGWAERNREIANPQAYHFR